MKGSQAGWVCPSATTLVTIPWPATEVTATNRVARIAEQRMVGKSVKCWGVKEEKSGFVKEMREDKPSGRGDRVLAEGPVRNG